MRAIDYFAASAIAIVLLAVAFVVWSAFNNQYGLSLTLGG